MAVGESLNPANEFLCPVRPLERHGEQVPSELCGKVLDAGFQDAELIREATGRSAEVTLRGTHVFHDVAVPGSNLLLVREFFARRGDTVCPRVLVDRGVVEQDAVLAEWFRLAHQAGLNRLERFGWVGIVERRHVRRSAKNVLPELRGGIARKPGAVGVHTQCSRAGQVFLLRHTDRLGRHLGRLDDRCRRVAVDRLHGRHGLILI